MAGGVAEVLEALSGRALGEERGLWEALVRVDIARMGRGPGGRPGKRLKVVGADKNESLESTPEDARNRVKVVLVGAAWGGNRSRTPYEESCGVQRRAGDVRELVIPGLP